MDMWIYITFIYLKLIGTRGLYFPKDTYKLLINKNTKTGTFLTQIRAFNNIDKFCETSEILYSLLTNDKSASPSEAIPLTIDRLSGEIKLMKQHDNDKLGDESQYTIKAICKSASSKVVPVTATLNISLTSVVNRINEINNKNGMHKFVNTQCWPDNYVFEVEENSKENLLYTLAQDQKDKIYRLDQSLDTSLDEYIKHHFTLSNTRMQQLILLHSLDREERDNIILNMSCLLTVGGKNIEISNKLFTVHVNDVDDNPPFFHETKDQLRNINDTKEKIMIMDRDIAGSNKNSYVITYTGQAVNVLKTLRFSPMPIPMHHFSESIEKSKTMGSAIIFAFTAKEGKSLSSLTSFEIHITDSEYKNKDYSLSNTVILKYKTSLNGRKSPSLDHDNHQAVLYRNASKYSQVYMVTPNTGSNHSSNMEYKLVGPNLFLAITNRSGIIYVISPVKLANYSKPDLSLNVRMDSDTGAAHTVVLVKIDGDVMSHGSRCNYGCSKSMYKNSCESECGYGSPNSQCKWRTGLIILSSAYATCRPNSATCPDGKCDDVEQLNQSICPQDCVEEKPKGAAFLNSKTSRGIGRAKSPCWCENGINVECSCGFETPIITDDSPSIAQDESQIVSNQTTAQLPTVMRKTDVLQEISSESCDASCRTTVAATVSCTLAILLMFISAWLIWKRRKKNSRILKHVGSILSMTAMPSDYIDEIEGRVSYASPHWPPSPKSQDVEVDINWEFPREDLILENTLGEGEFGQVVKGQAFGLDTEDGFTTVAVKMLKPDASGTEYQDLISELNLLKEVKHPNVIRLLGSCTQKGPFYVIVEFCEFGSLKNYLRKCKYRGRRSWDDKQNSYSGSYENETDIVLTTRDLLTFAWQTTRGMEYLSQMKLVHRDLAARNVLVASGRQLKISDFGLSRDVYEADTYLKMSKGRIPVKWMAPESLYAQIYTTKSDIWSFGVVLWEIVTLGANPYPGIPPERLFNLLKTGYRMDRPDDCPDELYAIMQKCWKAEPEDRPTFTALTYIIDRMLQDRVGYLELQGDSEYLVDTAVTSSSIEKKNPWHEYEEGYGSICLVKPDSYTMYTGNLELLSDDETNESHNKVTTEDESESRKCLLGSNVVKRGREVLGMTPTANIYSV